MSIFTTREQRRQLARDHAKLPTTLQQVPRSAWPDVNAPQTAFWRSRDFLVQVFDAEAPALARLSINRTEMAGDRWRDGITWDELQRLKAECGYRDSWMVEIFPPERELVNVANVRHLWLLREAPAFAWQRPVRQVQEAA